MKSKNEIEVIYNEKYKKVFQISSGYFDAVYLVENLVNHKKFALKLSRQIYHRNELNLLQNLKSQYIVNYVDSFRDNDFICAIVLEYCEAGHLGYQIRKMQQLNQKFEPEIIYNWIWQLINGMNFLHSNKIIHRDINPRNIFLKKNYQLKLGNFDLSRSLEEADDDENNESLTEHCDTVGYMSPEMRSSKNYSYKTDCWSAGCTIYELICLKYFYDVQANTYGELSLIESNLLTSSVFTDGTFNLIITAVKGMLIFNPEKRFSSEKLVKLIENRPQFTIDKVLDEVTYDTDNDEIQSNHKPKENRNSFISHNSTYLANTLTIETTGCNLTLSMNSAASESVISKKIATENNNNNKSKNNKKLKVALFLSLFVLFICILIIVTAVYFLIIKYEDPAHINRI